MMTNGGFLFSLASKTFVSVFFCETTVWLFGFSGERSWKTHISVLSLSASVAVKRGDR